MEKLLDAEQLAEILGMSRKTVIKNCTGAPDRLPPSLKVGSIHGARRWRPEAVRAWLEGQEKKMTGLRGTPLQVNPPAWQENVRKAPRRGRPTKQASIAKAQSLAAAEGVRAFQITKNKPAISPAPKGGVS